MRGFASDARLRRWRLRAHTNDMLKNRIPRHLLDAVTSEDAMAIAHAVGRALKDGVDLPREIRGDYVSLLAARGGDAIDAALARLSEDASGAFSGCTALDELATPDVRGAS